MSSMLSMGFFYLTVSCLSGGYGKTSFSLPRHSEPEQTSISLLDLPSRRDYVIMLDTTSTVRGASYLTSSDLGAYKLYDMEDQTLLLVETLVIGWLVGLWLSLFILANWTASYVSYLRRVSPSVHEVHRPFF